MHRKDLAQKIEDYSPELPTEKEFRVRFLAFIKANKDCFERTLAEGHITGSAWIVNKEKTKALLTHHFKLNKWLQLGGHADGDSDIIQVATKEAEEESGLASVKLLSNQVFDLDIHPIPARKGEPEHLHYDVRFLFEADENESLTISDESHDLAWLELADLRKRVDQNESILRMVEKTEMKKGTLLS